MSTKKTLKMLALFLRQSSIALLLFCGAIDCSVIASSPNAVNPLTNDLSTIFQDLDLASAHLLGEGTFASVKRISLPVNTTSRTTVAIKVFNHWDNLSNIRKESQIQNSLSHSNIIRSYGLYSAVSTNESSQIFYEPMEYIPLDLPKYLVKHQPLRADLLQLFGQVCSAVAYMHEKGVVHLDLKPENILITTDGVPKLIDFGAAEIVRSPLLVETETCLPQYRTSSIALVHGIGGSEPYMPPEVYAEEKYDGQEADIWSLGIILVQLLQRDFSGPWQFSAMEDEGFEAFVHAYHDGQVSFDDKAGVNDLLVDMLAIDPERRPTAEEVLHRLDGITVGKRRGI